jgi:hypothetical protein
LLCCLEEKLLNVSSCSSLVWVFFYPEDGSNKFILNIDGFLHNYMALHSEIFELSDVSNIPIRHNFLILKSKRTLMLMQNYTIPNADN